ncbi:acyl carrier protein [Clostridium estertheticum]|uniref:acyl carrier protein n=1 Tax=Clostridium estertheticum TaxID=238834 RepID=UPI001C7CE3C5|nr:phosphopantetheine-binding protein [Clostridium estertheticum]MBX4266831.1 acyl carrier protein [Clostridium estertheticum]WLC89017.1 acyl carrier protein [Clostridium estertheticum]
MANLTQEIKIELKKLVYDFFSEECEVELEKLNDQTTLMEDLDGDSLLFVELVELMKKKYCLNIQLQTVGKFLLKNPAETIGQVIKMSFLIYEHENDIVNLK